MNKVSFIILSFLCSFVFIGCKKKNYAISMPAYAIGTIVYYNDNNWGGDNSVEYSFIVNGEEYGNNYTNANWGIKWAIPNAHYKKGDMFMVEYDKGCENKDKCNDGEESRILFNYSVHDSSDYNNYVSQFAVSPPMP
jgi:hypothetical protein